MTEEYLKLNLVLMDVLYINNISIENRSALFYKNNYVFHKVFCGLSKRYIYYFSDNDSLWKKMIVDLK